MTAASDEREVKKKRGFDWHIAQKDKCSYHSITDHEKSYDAVFLFLKALKRVDQQFGGKDLLALLPRVRLEDTILSDVLEQADSFQWLFATNETESYLVRASYHRRA